MPFDVNKLYASEILSILLQQSSKNKILFGEYDGVDVILQQLAVIISKSRSLTFSPVGSDGGIGNEWNFVATCDQNAKQKYSFSWSKSPFPD